MSEEDRVAIPKLEGSGCFACGSANPIGLNLGFYRSGEWILTEFTLRGNYEGWGGMAHGGIISTVLDEIMSWAILYFKKVFFVTRKMEVKYVKPVLTGVPLKARGRLLDERRGLLIRSHAEILDLNNRILSRATGEFAELPPERLSSVPEKLKQDMQRLFDRFEGTTL